MYTIGKFAQLTGISIDTLRYYHKIGLLKPEEKNPSNGYHYYTHTQLLQADVIKVCRSMDMSIESIKASLQRQNSQEFQKLLKTQSKQLYDKIEELENALNQITHISERIEEWEQIKDKEELYCRNFPKRTLVASRPFPFEQKENDDVSSIYLELVDWMRFRQITFPYKGGYLYTVENGQIIEAQMCEIFDTELNIEDPQVIAIPQGLYQCKKYAQQERKEALSAFVEGLKRDRKQTVFILDSYLLSGNFNYCNRFFELQVLVDEWGGNFINC